MIQVTINDQQVRQMLGAAKSQLRYATAVALTRTAKDAQEEVRRQLPERFTIRTGWVSKGIRVKTASKNNLQATVYAKDDFMAIQESGGEKESNSGDAMGIPVGARPKETSVTRPSKFPGRLLEKSNHFLAAFNDDPQTFAVWRRGGRKGRKLKLMYVFAERVQIEPKFGFMDTVREVVEGRIQENFDQSLRDALATAR